MYLPKLAQQNCVCSESYKFSIIVISFKNRVTYRKKGLNLANDTELKLNQRTKPQKSLELEPEQLKIPNSA